MRFSSRILSLAQYPSSQLAARKKELAAKSIKIYDFGQGDPIEPTAAFIREAVGAGVPAVSQYPTVKGAPELRQAVKAYVKRRFNVDLDPETEILPCTGSKEAIYNLATLFIEPAAPKDTIIGPVPGYFVMERSAIVLGANYYPFYLNAENKFLMELSTVPADILERTAVAWINYPHNPTGVECDLDYLKRQVETAAKYDILLCSDECYVDLYFGQTRPPSVLEVAKKGVLAFHSCSKRSGMTAYRTGFIAGDSEVLKVYSGYRDTLGVATPIYTQRAAIMAWNDDSHPAERRRAFAEKRALFLKFFAEQSIEFTETDATFYFWIKAPKGLTGTEYAGKLLEKGLVVSPGDFFGSNSREYIRIALVPSAIDCAAAINLWREVT